MKMAKEVHEVFMVLHCFSLWDYCGTYSKLGSGRPIGRACGLYEGLAGACMEVKFRIFGCVSNPVLFYVSLHFWCKFY